MTTDLPNAIAADRGASASDFLLHRINYERTTSVPYQSGEFKLDRMRRLMHLLGDPHLGLKAIHIAGTKGKGSTAAMIASVLQAAGYRTGLYTSPHLERIEERVVIDGQPCPTDTFLGWRLAVQPAVERSTARAAAKARTGPTFFEVTTAMAFLHFAPGKRRCGRARSRPRRPAGFDERLSAGRLRHHQHQLRPHQAARQHAGRNCRRKSRHHQARRAGRLGVIATPSRAT